MCAKRMTFVAELLYPNILTQAAKALMEIWCKYKKINKLYLSAMNGKMLDGFALLPPHGVL